MGAPGRQGSELVFRRFVFVEVFFLPMGKKCDIVENVQESILFSFSSSNRSLSAGI